MKIPFWESCSPDFATQIILNLEARVYLPDDYIVRKGDTGAEMFMINRGICEVSEPAMAQQPNVNIVLSTSDKTSSGGNSGATKPTSAIIANLSNTSANDIGEDTAAKPQDQPLQLKHKALFKSGGSAGKDIRTQVYPHKGDYDLDTDERHEKTKAKKILLYPGQVFGEMSLMMNYKRTANIRAVTYVETCIFNRAAFQSIISRYPEDRKHVLTMMIKSCIEKKEIPFPWDEVIDAVTERRRKNGALEPSPLNVQTEVTSTEAAEALVDRIDVNKPDESIKYGFQTFHPDLKPSPPQDGSLRCVIRDGESVGRKNQPNSIERISSPARGDPDAIMALNSRVEGLENTLAAMMGVMTSMSAGIERLEQLVQTRDGKSCTCCPHFTQINEARGATIVTAPRLKRRRNSMPQARKMEPNEDPHVLFERTTERANLANFAKLISFAVTAEKLEAGSLAPVQSVDAPASATGISGSTKLPSAASYTLGWLTRHAAPRSESMLADKLWRRKHRPHTSKRGHRHSGEPLVGELLARSSFPSYVRRSSISFVTLDGQSQAERLPIKRRGSRVGIDAFTRPKGVDNSQTLGYEEPH